MNIHILGASGSGTTTLGKAISNKFHFQHFDTDDYFWLPTDPPYQKKRPKEKRQELLYKDLKKAPDWILSGSLIGWGDIFIPHFDLVIYLWVPGEIRIKRLDRRQQDQFGEQVLPGGKMYKTHIEFLEWASKYDTGGPDMRSKKSHQLWLSKLTCPVLRIEGNYKVEDSLRMVTEKLDELNKNT